MKAISLWQPHASLIAWGEKVYETRSWTTRYRGPIAIHASKNVKELQGIKQRLQASPWGDRPGFLGAFANAMIDWATREQAEISLPHLEKSFPFGAIVATAELTAIYDAALLYPKLTGRVRHFGDFGEGRYAWRLENIKPLPEPVYVSGKQGLWEWTP